MIQMIRFLLPKRSAFCPPPNVHTAAQSHPHMVSIGAAHGLQGQEFISPLLGEVGPLGVPGRAGECHQ